MSTLPTAIQKHGDFSKAIFTFEVPGETLLALFNALTFVNEHKEEYAQRIDACEECLAALKSFRTYLNSILQKAEFFAKDKPLTN